MNGRRDAEFTEYVQARLTWLRRVAYLLCQDWQQADDLVQTAITILYTHWGRVRSMDSPDGYVRTILVRTFTGERRTGWARRVMLAGRLPDRPAPSADLDGALDMRFALAVLPPRQRATLVLRFYSGLSVDQVAQELGCAPGTVKSQTAKALARLRTVLEAPGETAGQGRGGPGGRPGGRVRRIGHE